MIIKTHMQIKISMVPPAQSKVDGHLLLDPTSDESFREDGSMLLATLGASGDIAHLVASGSWGADNTRDSLELCLGGCVQLDAAVRQCLRDKANKPAT